MNGKQSTSAEQNDTHAYMELHREHFQIRRRLN